MTMIVTAGENVVDMIGKQGGAYQSVPGGSPLNIALALGRLDVECGYAMPISSDKLGDDLLSALEREGVRYLPPVRPDRPTGLALVFVAEEGQPSYSFYREGAADIGIQPGELPELASGVAHLQVGGSPSLGHDHCGDMVTEWALGLDPSISMSLDPNVRPALVVDKGRFLERCDRLMGRCSICRLSDEDARYMYGGAEPDEVADIVLAKGVALAVVTLGAKGALLATASERVRVGQAKPGRIKDTVAAGDCFLAAMLSWMHERDCLRADRTSSLPASALEEVGNYAAAGAAINCSRDGCDPPTRKDIEDLLGESSQTT